MDVIVWHKCKRFVKKILTINLERKDMSAVWIKKEHCNKSGASVECNSPEKCRFIVLEVMQI